MQAVHNLQQTQEVQGEKLREAVEESRNLEQRLGAVEAKLREVETQGPGAREDRDRRPAVLMGGWAPDTPAAQVQSMAAQVVATLRLDVDMTPAFTPGLRRGFVIIPLVKKQDEDDQGLRTRTEQMMARISQANVVPDKRPDGSNSKLWMCISQQGASREDVEADVGYGMVQEPARELGHYTTTQTLSGWIDLQTIANPLAKDPEA